VSSFESLLQAKKESLQAWCEAQRINPYGVGFSRNHLNDQWEAFLAPVPDDGKPLSLVASLLADHIAKHLGRLCSFWQLWREQVPAVPDMRPEGEISTQSDGCDKPSALARWQCWTAPLLRWRTGCYQCWTALFS